MGQVLTRLQPFKMVQAAEFTQLKFGQFPRRGGPDGARTPPRHAKSS